MSIKKELHDTNQKTIDKRGPWYKSVWGVTNNQDINTRLTLLSNAYRHSRSQIGVQKKNDRIFNGTKPSQKKEKKIFVYKRKKWNEKSLKKLSKEELVALVQKTRPDTTHGGDSIVFTQNVSGNKAFTFISPTWFDDLSRENLFDRNSRVKTVELSDIAVKPSKRIEQITREIQTMRLDIENYDEPNQQGLENLEDLLSELIDERERILSTRTI